MISCLHVFAILVAVLTAAIWPVLSAKLIIPVSAESLLFLLSIAMAVGLAGLAFRRSVERQNPVNMMSIASIVTGFLAIVLIAFIWHRSNDLFFYWAANPPQDVRRLMATQLAELGSRQLFQEKADYAQITRSDLAAQLRTRVSRENEFAYGLAQKDSAGVVNVGIAYGYKSRRWGLYLGNFMASRWPHARAKLLYGNTYFFVTTDY